MDCKYEKMDPDRGINGIPSSGFVNFINERISKINVWSGQDLLSFLPDLQHGSLQGRLTLGLDFL